MMGKPDLRKHKEPRRGRWGRELAGFTVRHTLLVAEHIEKVQWTNRPVTLMTAKHGWKRFSKTHGFLRLCQR